ITQTVAVVMNELLQIRPWSTRSVQLYALEVYCFPVLQGKAQNFDCCLPAWTWANGPLATEPEEGYPHTVRLTDEWVYPAGVSPYVSILSLCKVDGVASYIDSIDARFTQGLGESALAAMSEASGAASGPLSELSIAFEGIDARSVRKRPTEVPAGVEEEPPTKRSNIAANPDAVDDIVLSACEALSLAAGIPIQQQMDTATQTDWQTGQIGHGSLQAATGHLWLPTQQPGSMTYREVDMLLMPDDTPSVATCTTREGYSPFSTGSMVSQFPAALPSDGLAMSKSDQATGGFLESGYLGHMQCDNKDNVNEVIPGAT
ncbi:hypothetical protein FOZ62_000202, partial [Perkinsus olseni]